MKKIEGLADTLAAALIMVYSQGKMGKTSLMLAMPPEMRPCAFLDTDLGAQIRLKILGMTGPEREAAGVTENISPYYGPWIKEGIDFYYPSADNYYGDLWEFATKIAPKYKSTVTDAVSRMSRSILDEVKSTKYGGAKRLHIDRGGGTVSVQPNQGDYGLAQSRVLEYIEALNQSGAHNFLVSHERTAEIKDTDNVKRILGGPSSIGSALLEILPAIMDIIIRLEVKSVKIKKGDKYVTGNRVVMRTANHNVFQAGDRSGMFEDGDVMDPEIFWKRITTMIAGAKASA